MLKIHRTLPLLVVLPAGLLGAVAVVADPAPPSRPDAIPALFRSDRALDAPVTVSYRNRTVRDVLADLSTRLKVKLEATRDTGDDKVSLFLKDRPAGEALGLLANHLDFQWYRNSGVYELNQTNGSKRREAELRAAAVNEQLAAIQARMDRVGQLLSMGKEKLQARETELRDQVARGGVAPDARKATMDEMSALRDALRPGAGLAVTIWRGLTAQQTQHLQASGELKFSQTGGSLPKSMADQVHQASQEQRSSVRSFRIGPGGGEVVPGGEFPGQNDPPTDATITVKLTQNSPMRFGPIAGSPNRQLRLEFTLTSVRGDAMRRNVMPVMWSPAMSSIIQQGPPMQTETDDPELKQEVELFPAKAGVRPSGSDITGGGGGVLRVIAMPLGGSGQWPTGMPTVGEVSEAIHRVTGLEVVADSFTRARVDYAKVMGKKPLIRVLDTLAADLKYDWHKDGKRIYFRSQVWYDDRPAEVPDRIVLPWRNRVARAGAATLDDLAHLASSLSDPQCQGMQDHWGWYLENPTGTKIPPLGGISSFYGARNDLRFWAGMTVAQKRVALAGEVVPAGRMTPLQRNAFAAALATPTVGPAIIEETEDTPAAAVAAGGFTLRVGQMQQRTFSAGEGGNQGVISIIGGGPNGLPAPMPGAPGPRILTQDGQDLAALPTSKPVTLDSFQFRYHVSGNPAPARTASINVPRPLPRDEGAKSAPAK